MANSVKERLSILDKTLQDYESSLGLPPVTSPGTEKELNKYLTMNRNEIESLLPQEFAEISLKLNQYAFYIQRLYNQETAKLEWAQANLNKAIATHYTNYNNIYNHDVKVAAIIKEDQYAFSLYEVVTYATQRCTRLNFLANNLTNLSKVFYSNQQAKMKRD